MPLLKLPILRLRRFRLDRQQVFSFLRSDYPKLAAILGLAFYIAFIPHSDYPYPVHLDEWEHMADSRAVMETGDATASTAYLGNSVIAGARSMEAGFHVLLGIFHDVSGLSWVTIFRYLAAIIFLFTVLSVYVLGKRMGFGWQAALMTCFIITTVGILGPGFLVPVSMGLPIIVLFLFLAFNYREVWVYVTMFLLVLFLFLTHPPTAAGLGIVILPHIILCLKNDLRHSIAIMLCFALPLAPAIFVLGFDTISRQFNSIIDNELAEYVLWPVLIEDYGYLPAICCLIGTVFMMKKWERDKASLVAGLVVLLLMLVFYSQLHYGAALMYNRGLVYTMLMMGIVGGHGLAELERFSIPDGILTQMKVKIARNYGGMLALAMVVVMVIMAIPHRQNTPYYQMINHEDYEAFVWISRNMGDIYDKAILDPWKGAAFVAVTRKNVFSVTKATPDLRNEKTYEFLGCGCCDFQFLREQGISIIYSGRGCTASDLIEVREHVYIIEE